MYTTPSIADKIRSVMDSLNQDIAPELTSPHAKVCVAMGLSLLQTAIQRLEAEYPLLIKEHNEMIALYRSLAELLAMSPGAAAERVLRRSKSLGEVEPLPPPTDAIDLGRAHRQLSQGLIETLADLDQMLVGGVPGASAALDRVRQHLAQRSARDFQTHIVNPGSLVGRE